MNTTLSIMIIDDNEFDLFLQQKFIESENFTHNISSFCFADDAINFLENCKVEEMPDILLLDIHMPVTNGFEFIHNFNKLPRNKTQNTKIIIVSSSIDEGDIEKSKESPQVLCFLNKPLQVNELTRVLKDCGILN
ncbi:MAG: response regulator [Bacteroidia bacterium]|nr:response regulator [Bacteroidia bacterium]